MDELEISGKRYISTRRAAREHGYHSDYMGQLIRGKKVAGQKVGRAWYIEEDSLNVYLGKAPAAATASIQKPVPAPIDEPAAAEPMPVVEPVSVVEVAPEPIAPVIPAQMHAVVVEQQEPVAAPVETFVQEEVQPVPIIMQREEQPVMQVIHHAPYVEEKETFIPIRMPVRPVQEMGGLHYAADDSPTMPVVSRMPQAPAYTQPEYAPAKQRTGRSFPFVSLSIIGVATLLASLFAANFITASVVSEEGKAATVQYSIHW